MYAVTGNEASYFKLASVGIGTRQLSILPKLGIDRGTSLPTGTKMLN
jgi:hypothetical protein